MTMEDGGDGRDRRRDSAVMDERRGGGRVAHANSPRGEVFLLRRATDGALELRVNGVFVMDTVHTETERMLATSTLGAVEGPAGSSGVRVLVGGLGLGFTLHEVLADRRVGRVVVAEVEPAVVDWHRRGLVAEVARDAADPRVDVRCGDVTAVVGELADSCLEAILLDVDNGPGYLVHDDNSRVYRRRFLADCRRTLAPGGVAAVWSSEASPDLRTTLHEVFGNVEALEIPVTLGNHATTYHLYLGRGRENR